MRHFLFGTTLLFAIAAVGCSGGSDSGSGTPPSTPPATNTSSTPNADDAAAPKYEDVAMILQACEPCHSGPDPKEGLKFGTYADVMASVTASDAKGSRIVKALRGDGMKQMPPNGPLPEDKIKTIESWIAAGAKEK